MLHYWKNDSILVVAAGNGFEICDNDVPINTCHISWSGKVYKMNIRTKERIWDTSLSGGTLTDMYYNGYLDIIQSIEKDGYILCGAGYNTIPGCRTDTIDKCWANPGIIAKVSNNGDSLWLRKYFGITNIIEFNRLYDAEISPDSGYSFIGEAVDGWPGPTSGSHGWVLMTDKYGCLVPGCQLVSSVDDPTSDLSDRDYIKIYPNPASDFLNVLITKKLPNDATLHLFNLIGQEVGHWSNFEKGATYIIPVQDFEPGLYTLTLNFKNSILSTQSVVITRP